MGRRPKQTFLPKDIQKGNRGVKICSLSLMLEKRKSKLHWDIPSRWSEQPLPNNNALKRRGGKGALPHCWWEGKMLQTFWGTVWRFLKKLKVELPYNPAILLLGIYPEKPIIWKVTCTPMFTAVLFTRAKTWKQTECPLTDKWIKKMWHVCVCVCARAHAHTHAYAVEYYSAIKKNEIMPSAAAWIYLEIIIISEDREWQNHMISLICGI